MNDRYSLDEATVGFLPQLGSISHRVRVVVGGRYNPVVLAASSGRRIRRRAAISENYMSRMSGRSPA